MLKRFYIITLGRKHTTVWKLGEEECFEALANHGYLSFNSCTVELPVDVLAQILPMSRCDMQTPQRLLTK